jgi:hypothetical protein
MREVCSLIWLALIGAWSRVSLEAENTILRHQLNVLRRQSPKRPTFGMLDRLIFAGLYRLAPNVLGALAILKPETVIKWHRAGFRSYWRWKSRRRGGRPTVAPEIRKLIREMSIANPLWGAPQIHGELLTSHVVPWTKHVRTGRVEMRGQFVGELASPKTPSPSSRLMSASPPREPSMPLSEPPPMRCNSSNPTNA